MPKVKTCWDAATERYIRQHCGSPTELASLNMLQAGVEAQQLDLEELSHLLRGFPLTDQEKEDGRFWWCHPTKRPYMPWDDSTSAILRPNEIGARLRVWVEAEGWDKVEA